MEADSVAVCFSPPTRGSRGRAVYIAWTAVLVLAVVLPVQATTHWLRGAYGATPAELVSGIWILKAALALLALAGLALYRFAPPEPAAGPAVGSVDQRDRRLIGALLLLALVLRTWSLGTELWYDEILLRTRYVPLDMPQLVSTYDSQNHQPLYSILARASFLALGDVDWATRIPAVLFGVASVGALWVFARRVTSSAEAILSALILAVSYHHVWFSQNARGYTLMMFLTVVGSHAFLKLCDGESRAYRLAWVYATIMALATYTHLTAAIIAMSHGLALILFTVFRRDHWRRTAWPFAAIVLSGLLTVVAYAPMLPQVWRQMSRPTMGGIAIEWTGVGWMVSEGLRVLSGGTPGGLLMVAVAVGVLAVGVTSYWRQSPLTTLMMFLPVALTMLAIVVTRHNLWPRFFFFASGFLVLAAIRGGFVVVRRAWPRHADQVAFAGALGVAAVSLVTVPGAWQPKQQFRAAFEFIEGERLPDDVVATLDLATRVYDLRQWAPSWRSVTDAASLASIERSAVRAWIVYTMPARIRATSPGLLERLVPPRYTVVRVFPATVGGGQIHVLRYDSPQGHD